MAKIVVIDDMIEMRMLYNDLLSAWGHDVLLFDDAAPALADVNFSEVDLVITDLQMPTPGQLLIRAVRACGHQVPIMVVSGNIDATNCDDLTEMGAQSVMSKPPDFKVFRQTIADLLVMDEVPWSENASC